ncbi:MAG: deoxyribonuclease IV [Dehalococcoidia bacterium]
MHIGAHVSSSGSLDKSIDRACEIGAEAVQFFATAPQSWRHAKHKDAVVEAFRQRATERSIDQVFLHAIYLINLATELPENLAKSVQSLKATLQIASQIGARGAIFHVGSHKGIGFDQVLAQIAQAMTDILNDTPQDSLLIVENSAGMGGSIGSSFDEVGAIVRAVGDARVKVCLDTCHLFAAGYDLRTSEAVAETMAQFDFAVGLDRLVAIHANDSKAPLGGGLDRHENIGEGHIGLEGFRSILGHPAFANLPLLLEVPGFEKGGPDRRNVELLQAIRAGHGLAAPQPPVVSSDLASNA